MMACGNGARVATDAAAPESDDAARGRALLSLEASLPPRPEALALGQTLEARALKEPSPQRAAEIHQIAGRLFERTWRRYGVDEDAKEARRAYESAARDSSYVGACDSALASAQLAGDLARDAEVTYVEIYRAMKRIQIGVDAGAPPAASESSCAERARSQLQLLAAFRPSERVLRAVDAATEAQGAFGSGPPPDASVPRMGPAKISALESWSGREAARVVITLSDKASFRAGDDALDVDAQHGRRALRTFVDLDGVELGDVARATPSTGIVRSVSVEHTTTGARVLLALEGQEAYRKVFFLMEPYRVVIDVARRAPGVGTRRKVASVALDPGQGGNDAGARGPAGIKEKDVTLAIARRARALLVRDGLEVSLTRDDDRYVTLEERTARANQQGADLFVSIHCNAAESHARHGVETYVLDTTKDDIAARVAARENATSVGANVELGSILANMRLADQATHSNKLAELLQKSAMSSLRSKYDAVSDGGLHYAGFYVLVGARMPAVLFETSYVSNPTEEERLASDDYQQRLADAIANAIKAYREGR